jgi:GTPase Era involved in 16S rRNA processing
MTRDDAQIIFIDTPGIHKPKHKLGDYMMKVATNTLSDNTLNFVTCCLCFIRHNRNFMSDNSIYKCRFTYIDTPGIHKPKHKLGDYMMKVATNTLSEIDAIMFMVNVNEDIGRGDEYIFRFMDTRCVNKYNLGIVSCHNTLNFVTCCLCFIPGIHKPKHKLGDYMMKVATNTLSEIDAIMFMVNVNVASISESVFVATFIM